MLWSGCRAGNRWGKCLFGLQSSYQQPPCRASDRHRHLRMMPTVCVACEHCVNRDVRLLSNAGKSIASRLCKARIGIECQAVALAADQQ